MHSTVWYQIHPFYFHQIIQKQDILSHIHPEERECSSLFKLTLYCLDYIQSLNFNGIWFLPLYVRGEKNKKGQGSPYSIKEYELSPEWGSEDEFLQLQQAIKDRGMKLICEYVPNHVSPDCLLLESNRDIYYKDVHNLPYYDQNWSDTIKLNHSNPLVQGYTSANIAWLLKKYNFDGFRIDMAHYPLHDAINVTFNGKGDENFWQKVLNSPLIDREDKVWIAEVYDDRSKGWQGYEDHQKLIKEGMTTYDKKTHDIVSYTLREQAFHQPVQWSIYHELLSQYQALEYIGHHHNPKYPFLRIFSNHDDNPAINSFGSVLKAELAFKFLSALPGQYSLYAGEEYGLSVKPSIVGEKIQINDYVAESDEIVFLSKEQSMEHTFDYIQSTLKLRAEEELLQSGATVFFEMFNQESQAHPHMVVFSRYEIGKKELILIAANFSDTEDSWGEFNKVFPNTTSDVPEDLRWYDFVSKINPLFAEKGYTVTNLLSGEQIDSHDLNYNLWIGLKPLEVQFLKLSVNCSDYFG